MDHASCKQVYRHVGGWDLCAMLVLIYFRNYRAGFPDSSLVRLHLEGCMLVVLHP